jgi:SAM-dependent methyltransferase
MSPDDTLDPMQPVPVPTPDVPRYPAPVSARRALAIATLLEVPPEGAVLDLGDGPAGLLLDVVALHGCRGLGLVDSEARAVAGRTTAEREGLGARLEFRLGAAAEFVPARRFDALLCVGNVPWPAAALEGTVERGLEWVRTGGLFVYGEPFLRRPPAPVYRELLGEAGAGLRLPGVSARAIVAAGFELALTVVLSESEWDAHESAAYRAELRRAAGETDDGAAAVRREYAERRYQAYWRHGRDTLGYALHAFRKPRQPLRLV